jgi:hypothetical protein
VSTYLKNTSLKDARSLDQKKGQDLTKLEAINSRNLPHNCVDPWTGDHDIQIASTIVRGRRFKLDLNLFGFEFIASEVF